MKAEDFHTQNTFQEDGYGGGAPENYYFHQTIKILKYKWQWKFHDGINWQVEIGKEPNAFYCWMQRIFLGIIWTEITDTKPSTPQSQEPQP